MTSIVTCSETLIAQSTLMILLENSLTNIEKRIMPDLYTWSKVVEHSFLHQAFFFLINPDLCTGNDAHFSALDKCEQCS